MLTILLISKLLKVGIKIKQKCQTFLRVKLKASAITSTKRSFLSGKYNVKCYLFGCDQSDPRLRHFSTSESSCRESFPDNFAEILLHCAYIVTS